MPKFKKILCIFTALAMTMTVAACSSANNSSGENQSSDIQSSGGESSSLEPAPGPSVKKTPEERITALRNMFTYDTTKTEEFEALHTAKTKPDDAIDVKMSTDKGDITIRLFPSYAPKAVENFVTHAKNGYYDGLTFHRILNNFMIQGGDPKGNSTGGESIWGEPFEDEVNEDLHHFRGAISMANSGTDTNGSQFFIVQAGTDEITESQATALAFQSAYNKLEAELKRDIRKKVDEGLEGEALTDYVSKKEDQLREFYENGTTQEMIDTYLPAFEYYLKVGGTPYLDNRHTVFGYVLEGMDIVDEIAGVAVADENGSPLKNVVINKVEVL